MSTATSIETSNLEALDFEPQCEHKNHDRDTHIHGGPAVWIQRRECTACSRVLSVLVCDPWRQTISLWSRQGGRKIICSDCDQRIDPATTMTFTRI